MASGPALDLSAIMNKKGNLRKVGQPLERQNSDPKDIKDYGDTSELRNAFAIFRAREKGNVTNYLNIKTRHSADLELVCFLSSDIQDSSIDNLMYFGRM